jgi:hypothetical protein
MPSTSKNQKHGATPKQKRRGKQGLTATVVRGRKIIVKVAKDLSCLLSRSILIEMAVLTAVSTLAACPIS